MSFTSGRGSVEVSRLIAEVHRRPELWDRQHPQHHNRSVLDHHWESVADLLGITGKAARGKWKNLKDHFRKEFKRCATAGNGDRDASRWPYFYKMMFIREQITHAADATAAFLSDFQYRDACPTTTATAVTTSAKDAAAAEDGGVAWYRSAGGSPPAAAPRDDLRDNDDDDDGYGDGGGGGGGYRPLNCLHVEYGDRPDPRDDGVVSDDEHFLLSLLPTFSALAPDKKLRARIAIETLLLNIAYPDQLTPVQGTVRGAGVGDDTDDDGPRSPRGRRSAERQSAGVESAAGPNGVNAPDTTTTADDRGSASDVAAVVTATCTAVKAGGGDKKRKSETDGPQNKKSCGAHAR